MDKRAVAKYETREEVADRLDGKRASQDLREGDTLNSKRKNLIKLSLYIETKKNPILITDLICNSISKICIQEVNQPHAKS